MHHPPCLRSEYSITTQNAETSCCGLWALSLQHARGEVPELAVAWQGVPFTLGSFYFILLLFYHHLASSSAFTNTNRRFYPQRPSGQQVIAVQRVQRSHCSSISIEFGQVALVLGRARTPIFGVKLTVIFLLFWGKNKLHFCYFGVKIKCIFLYFGVKITRIFVINSSLLGSTYQIWPPIHIPP